ncbi:hypothetical protein Bbelb_036020 [Branchiostoma belcheri]|nr:hypothetical protein Bbelb_036020 [Branchiostoma belcheri]
MTVALAGPRVDTVPGSDRPLVGSYRLALAPWVVVVIFRTDEYSKTTIIAGFCEPILVLSATRNMFGLSRLPFTTFVFFKWSFLTATSCTSFVAVAVRAMKGTPLSTARTSPML